MRAKNGQPQRVRVGNKRKDGQSEALRWLDTIPDPRPLRRRCAASALEHRAEILLRHRPASKGAGTPAICSSVG